MVDRCYYPVISGRGACVEAERRPLVGEVRERGTDTAQAEALPGEHRAPPRPWRVVSGCPGRVPTIFRGPAEIQADLKRAGLFPV